VEDAENYLVVTFLIVVTELVQGYQVKEDGVRNTNGIIIIIIIRYVCLFSQAYSSRYFS